MIQSFNLHITFLETRWFLNIWTEQFDVKKYMTFLVLKTLNTKKRTLFFLSANLMCNGFKMMEFVINL